MVEMARSIERSPLRQAALETVRCDPVLVELCAGLRDADCRKRGAPVPGNSPLRTLAGDLLARHLARCREDAPGADGDDLGFLGLFLGRVRDDDSADLLLFFLVETLD
jgi:hypothetical protein